jgi:hypothetical protein
VARGAENYHSADACWTTQIYSVDSHAAEVSYQKSLGATRTHGSPNSADIKTTAVARKIKTQSQDVQVFNSNTKWVYERN